MNKDLDDRLIPNGEYRDAQNISVGKSEADDIGALENVLGNALVVGSQLLTYNGLVIGINGAGNGVSVNGDYTVVDTQTGLAKARPGMTITGIDSTTGLPFANIITSVSYDGATNRTSLSTAYDTQVVSLGDNVNIFSPLEIIGQYSDKPNNRIIMFLTDKDVNQQWPPNITNYYNPVTQFNCYIVIYALNNTPTLTIVASGSFLNFSVLYPMTGITMIENLLFFTDNNNQPRQLNVSNPSTYYTNEDHISVAKYAPFTPPSLVRKTIGTVQGSVGGSAAVGWQVEFPANTSITVGMSVVSRAAIGNAPRIAGDSFIYVAGVSTAGSVTTVTLSPEILGVGNFPVAQPVVGELYTFYASTMTNQSQTPNWPGDPDFLEDRFVRFSYRFKFDDNEYSIIAPFSQIAFVPKQKGYFFNGDEDDAYQSTVVTWMDNFIQQIQLLITLPSSATTINTSYKISQIDILYKESDATAVKVVESINVNQIGTIIGSDNTKQIFYGDGVYLPDTTLVYTYQSRKPYKTLPEADTVRVYDKVPVKALAQESAGNRIIYGNYYDKHTPPASINYNVAFVDKSSNIHENWIEYPNHSVKQNRNYQIGFILSDRYGRQSPVILSSVNQTDLINYVGSTIYAPYESNPNFDVKGWFGNALQVAVNSPGIQSSVSLDGPGAPGLYNPTIGANYNPLGWYSYKIVVRQQEQDYYNVYLPGILNGYPLQISTTPVAAQSNDTYNANAVAIQLKSSPGVAVGDRITNSGGSIIATVTGITENVTGSLLSTTPLIYSVSVDSVLTFTNPNTYIPFPIGEDNKTANVVLINDNINKVPRDLSEVGPEQKQFRSSVQLFGRVQNTISNSIASNEQFYGVSPNYARASNTVVSIGEANDTNIIYNELAEPGGKTNFYQIDTNPLIARISTPYPIGVLSKSDVNTNMKPFLAIYETEPVNSLLDIFWETSSTGLISELNAEVNVDNTSPSYFTDTNYLQKENQISSGITAIDVNGVSVGGTQLTITQSNVNIVSTMEVYNANGDRVGNVTSTNGTLINITSAAIAITIGTSVTFQSTIAGNQYSRYVTDFFRPATASGLELNNATVALSTVLSDLGINLDLKFGLYAATAQDGGTNAGSYRIYIKEDTFSFLNNSLAITNARDKYNFTLAVTPFNSVSPVSLTTLGSLTNIAPVLTTALIPTLTNTSQIIDYKATNSVNNGSNYAAYNEQDLKFEIDSITPSGSFSITPYAGVISQTINTNPQGTYTLQIRVSDAIDTGSGAVGNGSLPTIPALTAQEITVGANVVNASALTINCVADVVLPRSDADTQTDKACVANGIISGSSNVYTGVWYIANGNLISTDLPAQAQPVMQTGGGTVISGAYKLGSAHTSGTIAFLLNSRIYKSTSIPNTNPEAELTWRIWRRPVGGGVGDWTENFADLNNMQTANTPVSFDPITYGASQGDTMYNQVIKAYERGGGSDNFEYCIAATSMYNTAVDDPSTTEKLVAWVQSTDLNFPRCVVENGVTITNTYYSSTYYNYKNTGGLNLPYLCNVSTQGDLYSSIPYGEYINQFFTNPARTTAWQPTNYDGTNPIYRWNVHGSSINGGSLALNPFTSLVLNGTFNSSNGSVYRNPSVLFTDADVYSCWSGNPNATTIQRQGKS